jgi:ribosomal-protein-alanine N-acetyltransferase
MRMVAGFSRTAARHHVAMPAMPRDLETPRLVARVPRADDAAAMLAIYAAPEVAARLYPDGRPRTETEVRAMLCAGRAHWRAHGFGRMCFIERDSAQIVARCGAKHAIIGGRPEIDLHWTVRADRHRRGLAAEAAEAVVRACFAALGLASVTARARVDNVASQAVAASLGFARERDVEHLGQPHRLYRRVAPE